MLIRVLLLMRLCVVLQESPEDETAFTCKIVCFIQLGKFEEALAAIRKNAKLARYDSIMTFPFQHVKRYIMQFD